MPIIKRRIDKTRLICWVLVLSGGSIFAGSALFHNYFPSVSYFGVTLLSGFGVLMTGFAVGFTRFVEDIGGL